tara:strand:+ start:2013 stop:2324 length:312 start_codon:yes stop_codon:yes gene_type:complete
MKINCSISQVVNTHRLRALTTPVAAEEATGRAARQGTVTIGTEEIEVGDSEDRTVDVVSIEAIILEIGHTLIWMILKDSRTKLKLKRGVRLTTEIYLVDNLYG